MGDGLNDAPACKVASVGVSMATGSKITQEASDIILVNDSIPDFIDGIAYLRELDERRLKAPQRGCEIS